MLFVSLTNKSSFPFVISYLSFSFVPFPFPFLSLLFWLRNADISGLLFFQTAGLIPTIPRSRRILTSTTFFFLFMASASGHRWRLSGRKYRNDSRYTREIHDRVMMMIRLTPVGRHIGQEWTSGDEDHDFGFGGGQGGIAHVKEDDILW